jgi:prepilin-type processing-associated H-X9-DG protein
MDIMRWGYIQPQRDYNDVTEMVLTGLTTTNTTDLLLYYTFGSAHATSSNYAMCDGSVRPISYNVTLSVFMKLSSINWNLPLSLVPKSNLAPIPMNF